MQTRLKEIFEPLLSGSIRIDDWWKANEDYFNSISSVDNGEDAMIWSAGFYRYGMYLHNEGYSKKSVSYIDRAIEILEQNKSMFHENDFYESYETMLNSKAKVLFSLEKYWDAYKIMKNLCKINPAKDDYRLGKKNLLSASMSKICNPIFVVLACIWGIMLLEKYVFHTHFIPSVTWEITWIIWIVLLIVDFVVPYAIYKLGK